MEMFNAVRIGMVPKERKNDQTEHIECHQPGNKESYDWYEVMPGEAAKCKRTGKDLILAHKSGGKRNPADRKRVHEESEKCDRHFRLQAAHIPDVLRIGMVIPLMVQGMMHGMDDRARAK